MRPAFFGQFLVDRGAITTDQLLDALNAPDDRHMANLAVSKAILTRDAADALLLKARSSSREFAQLALNKKMISAEQLEYLAFIQKSDNRRLMAALAGVAVLTAEELERHFADYNLEHRQFALRPQQLPTHLAGRADVVTLLTASEGLLIDRGFAPVQTSVATVHSGAPITRERTARATLLGDRTGTFAISLDHRLAVVLAGQLFGPIGLHEEELMRDAVREVCNLILGTAASMASTAGHHLEFRPPVYVPPEHPSWSVGTWGRWEIQTPSGVADVLAE